MFSNTHSSRLYLWVVEVCVQHDDGECHCGGCTLIQKDRGGLSVIVRRKDGQNPLNLLGLAVQPHLLQKFS